MVQQFKYDNTDHNINYLHTPVRLSVAGFLIFTWLWSPFIYRHACFFKCWWKKEWRTIQCTSEAVQIFLRFWMSLKRPKSVFSMALTLFWSDTELFFLLPVSYKQTCPVTTTLLNSVLISWDQLWVKRWPSEVWCSIFRMFLWLGDSQLSTKHIKRMLCFLQTCFGVSVC